MQRPSPGPPKTFNESVLAEIRSMSSRLNEQANQISAIAATISSGEVETGQWTEVVKRRTHQKKTALWVGFS